ncbi:MAG: hypothetical protein WC522_07660 [Candidatus Omnitrophota bacterium]
MVQKIKETLEKISEVLKKGNEDNYTELIYNALNGQQDKLWEFLVSNELWGGAGSIADQALLDKKELRKKLNEFLVELGNMQINVNKVNDRTEMWVTALKK